MAPFIALLLEFEQIVRKRAKAEPNGEAPTASKASGPTAVNSPTAA
jgi:hypothetical protein